MLYEIVNIITNEKTVPWINQETFAYAVNKEDKMFVKMLLYANTEDVLKYLSREAHYKFEEYATVTWITEI